MTAPQEIAELVNIYRAGNGLPPLVFHEAVAEVAQAHAEAIAAGRAPYSHAGLEDRFAEVGRRVRVQTMGENLAAVPRGTVTPLNRAVEKWVESAPHRNAIEGCFDLTGVGVAMAPNGTTYFTQLFVLRAPGQPFEARRAEDLATARCR